MSDFTKVGDMIGEAKMANEVLTQRRAEPLPGDFQMSPTIGKLAAALAKAQGAIRGAKKESVNPAFRQGYHYADLESVWEAMREPLSKNGLSLAQFPCQNDKGIALINILAHESGEWIRAKMTMPAVAETAHGMGSAYTYARRYSAAAIVGVNQTDDDGNAASEKPIPLDQKDLKKAVRETPQKVPAKVIFVELDDKTVKIETPSWFGFTKDDSLGPLLMDGIDKTFLFEITDTGKSVKNKAVFKILSAEVKA